MMFKVNGRRIDPLLVPTDEMAQARVKRIKPVDSIPPPHILAVLTSIHLEHIAEMTYHDCTDMSVGKIGSDRALFVVLKPGIGFEPGRGSYVVAADTTRQH